MSNKNGRWIGICDVRGCPYRVLGSDYKRIQKKLRAHQSKSHGLGSGANSPVKSRRRGLTKQISGKPQKRFSKNAYPTYFTGYYDFDIRRIESAGLFKFWTALKNSKNPKDRTLLYKKLSNVHHRLSRYLGKNHGLNTIKEKYEEQIS